MAKSSGRGVKGEKSRGMGKYPAGNINQHKMLATGEGLRSCNKSDKGGDVGLRGDVSTKHFSSSGTTGGPMNKKTPRSTTVPDKKGPRGHSVPKSTMTNY